jgi:hypothetical protein
MDALINDNTTIRTPQFGAFFPTAHSLQTIYVHNGMLKTTLLSKPLTCIKFH